MTKKVSSIKEHKQKKGEFTAEDSARAAAQRFLKPEYDSLEEPVGLASGKLSESGGFVTNEKDENEG